MSDQFTSQIQIDRKNAVIARPTVNETGNRNQLFMGKVVEVNSNNTYKVDLLGDDSITVLNTYDGVFVNGGQSEYSVDALVHLKFANSHDYPEIMATGGGGSTCSIMLDAFGVLYE